jgi:putative transposase
MVSETTANGSRERTQRTVALDQSALLEVLDALTAAEVDDRIRQAAQTIYQALIEAELTAVIGAAPTSAPTPGSPSAMGIALGS